MLEMPNLAIRSQAYWMHLALRRARRCGARTGYRARRASLAALYLPASFAYRVALALASRSGSARNRNGLGGWPRS